MKKFFADLLAGVVVPVRNKPDRALCHYLIWCSLQDLAKPGITAEKRDGLEADIAHLRKMLDTDKYPKDWD